jgi:hypothetical protein
MYSYCYICSVLCIVLLCCSVYCLCVNVYCTTATGCQPISVNKFISYIMSYITSHIIYHITAYHNIIITRKWAGDRKHVKFGSNRKNYKRQFHLYAGIRTHGNKPVEIKRTQIKILGSTTG